MAALASGVQIKPGEVFLAHNGLPFLDELPKFPALGSKWDKAECAFAPGPDAS